MKKKMLILSAAAGIAALIGTGCTSVETNRTGGPVQIHMPVFVQPTIEAKNEMISGSATIHSLFGIFSWGVDSQAVGVDYGFATESRGVFGDLLAFASNSNAVARNAAMYDAVTRSKADVVLAPQYVLKTNDYVVYKSINCKVKGFPGVLKGVRIVDCKKACPGTCPAAK